MARHREISMSLLDTLVSMGAEYKKKGISSQNQWWEFKHKKGSIILIHDTGTDEIKYPWQILFNFKSEAVLDSRNILATTEIDLINYLKVELKNFQ